MRRTSLTLAGAIVCLALACAASAAAAGTHSSAIACSARSKNVIEKPFLVSVERNNVDPSQARYGTCAYAKKVVGGLTSLRIEEPKVVQGFRCTPRVLSTEPDVVKYGCLFRGADTATEIKITFKVKYDLD
jgi:hypothetical protein